MADTGYKYAGFWWRVLAYIIDVSILVIAGTIAGFILGFAWAGSGVSAFSVKVWNFLILSGWNWLYYALFESSSWRATLGKKACGLLVVDLNGNRISFGSATGRYFGKIVSSLILGIGFLMAGMTKKKQALHDSMAGTLVLKWINEAPGVKLPSEQDQAASSLRMAG